MYLNVRSMRPAFSRSSTTRSTDVVVFSCRVFVAAVLLSILLSTPCSSTDPITFHEEYCRGMFDDQEPQGGLSSAPAIADLPLGFSRGFLTGGSPFFDSHVTGFSLRRSSKTAFLRIQNVTLNHDQETPRIVVDASLFLRNRSRLWSAGMSNATRVFRHARARRDPSLRPGALLINLKGFWSPHTGMLCMAGCFLQDYRKQSNASDCKVRAVFRYPHVNTIRQPFVKGTVQSMRERSSPLFFEPMYTTAVYGAPFVFKEDVGSAETGLTAQAYVPQNVNVWKDDSAVCMFPWYKQPLTVTWDNQCSVQNCSPFKAVGPTTVLDLLVENVICSEGKVHGFFVFTNHSLPLEEARISSVNDVLALEGVWNSTTGRLRASACHLEVATNSSALFDPTDCDIIITLQFPITLELTFRYSVIGRVERKKASKLKPFKPFIFTGHLDISYGSIGWGRSPPPLEYAYTPKKIMEAANQCHLSSSGLSTKSNLGKKKLKYPDGQMIGDLEFSGILKVPLGSSSGIDAFFSLVAINDRINAYFNPSLGVVTSSVTSYDQGSLNVSFDINVQYSGSDIDFMRNTRLSHLAAEGVYDPKEGLLCLSVCRALSLLKVQGVAQLYDLDKDCEMHITARYPPTNPGYFDERQIRGQLRSLRDQNDTLFFKPVDITSGPIFYGVQAVDTLAQMDFEIVMVMISLTMAALFIGLQLRYVKMYPKALPQISLLMLSILILGHFIPLVLNFEAVFGNTSWRNTIFLNGAWLEINEVIVRLMTMMVFLMLIRLLYLAWVSKCESVSEGPWHREKYLCQVCLSTYGLAGLSAMIVYGVKGSHFLDVLKGFAGLMIDFFLFPQVIGNYVWEIRDVILSFPFYLGMTFVRTLPHVYDIVRKIEFFRVRDRTYFYASPSWDFYSNAWDVAIPCGGLILAMLVFCQQRYGGAFFSPALWRQRRMYNQISMSPIG